MMGKEDPKKKKKAKQTEPISETKQPDQDVKDTVKLEEAPQTQ